MSIEIDGRHVDPDMAGRKFRIVIEEIVSAPTVYDPQCKAWKVAVNLPAWAATKIYEIASGETFEEATRD